MLLIRSGTNTTRQSFAWYIFSLNHLNKKRERERERRLLFGRGSPSHLNVNYVSVRFIFPLISYVQLTQPLLNAIVNGAVEV